jgi:hypothetical protein
VTDSSDGLTISPESIPSRAHVGVPRISSRHYFSSLHLWSSIDSATRCEQREVELFSVAHYAMDHRVLVVNSVMSAVAFLEALANEVFQGAADRDAEAHVSPRVAPLSDSEVAALTTFWAASRQGERYVSVLDKFQIALLLCGKERLLADRNPSRMLDTLWGFGMTWCTGDPSRKNMVCRT